jgi:hypothetical protein
MSNEVIYGICYHFYDIILDDASKALKLYEGIQDALVVQW